MEHTPTYLSDVITTKITLMETDPPFTLGRQKYSASNIVHQVLFTQSQITSSYIINFNVSNHFLSLNTFVILHTVKYLHETSVFYVCVCMCVCDLSFIYTHAKL